MKISKSALAVLKRMGQGEKPTSDNSFDGRRLYARNTDPYGSSITINCLTVRDLGDNLVGRKIVKELFENDLIHFTCKAPGIQFHFYLTKAGEKLSK